MPVVKKVYAININAAGKNSNFRRSSYTLLDDARNECLTLIRLDTASCNQRINLTQLRRNSRSRKDKTSGRKRPRVDDCDVVAAPDSPSCKQTISNPPMSNPLTTHPPISDPPTTHPLISDPPMSNPPTTHPPISDPLISDPPMSNPAISIPSKAKRCQRKKVRLNDPKNNEKEPEILPHFDKLYIATRQGEKLDDNHISAACKLLHRQFPDVQGLCTPVLGQNLSFPPVNSTFF